MRIMACELVRLALNTGDRINSRQWYTGFPYQKRIARRDSGRKKPRTICNRLDHRRPQGAGYKVIVENKNHQRYGNLIILSGMPGSVEIGLSAWG